MDTRALSLINFGWRRILPPHLQYGPDPMEGGPPESAFFALLALDFAIHDESLRIPPGVLHVHPIDDLQQAAAETERGIVFPPAATIVRKGEKRLFTFAYNGGAFGCILRWTKDRVLKISSYPSLDTWTIREAFVTHSIQSSPLAPRLFGMYIMKKKGVKAGYFDRNDRDSHCPDFNGIFAGVQANPWVLAFDLLDYPSGTDWNQGKDRWIFHKNHLKFFVSEMLLLERSLDFVHGDFKVENTVWDSKRKRPVLIDFGVSTISGIVNHYRLGRDPPGGSHLEPYVLLFAKKGWKLPLRKQDADIWALGMDILSNLVYADEPPKRERAMGKTPWLWTWPKSDQEFKDQWIPFQKPSWSPYVNDVMTAVLFSVGFNRERGQWRWNKSVDPLKQIRAWSEMHLKDANGKIWEMIKAVDPLTEVKKSYDINEVLQTMEKSRLFKNASSGLLHFVQSCLRFRQDDHLKYRSNDSYSFWDSPLSVLLDDKLVW